MKKRTVLTGITTTGTPHLGNYVGAIKPCIAASHDEDVQSYYFLADYHALVKNQDPERMQRSTLEIAATWLALGLDTGPGRVLPADRHSGDPRADLDPDCRDRQGPDEPRACLQGGGAGQRGGGVA
jgi:hypothetical protein